MGHQVTVHGEPVTIDQETTAAELKDAVGASDDDVATYRKDGRLHALSDQDHVADHVEDGGQVSFQPARGRLFG